MVTLGKKEEYHKTYKAKDNILYREMSTVWGIESHFKGSYYEDYLEMNNPSITWRDKYTFCNIEPGCDADKRLFPYQPVPDYLRWLQTGEFYYLSQEKLKNPPVGSWTKLPSLFMPTDILDLAFDCAVLEKLLNRSPKQECNF